MGQPVTRRGKALTTAALAPAAQARPHFQAHSPLRSEIGARVSEYFDRHDLDEKGGARFLLKAATILAWAATSYVLLVFFASTWWMATALAMSLGFAMAGIGFAIMHDGGHGAASRQPWVNRLVFATLDLIGASSYFWNHKHNIIHHTYTNVDGLDDDIDSTPFLRMGDTQRRFWYHRFQSWYEIPLLFFFSPKWAFFDDWRTWVTGKVGATPIPRPRGLDALQAVAGKVFFYGWAIALPLALHPVSAVVTFFLVTTTTLGITLAMVFQLAHSIEETEFVPLPAAGERLERSFFEHQIATTADFAPRNPLVTWYVGGLNFQVEHHLFPKIGHRHYPALREIVKEVCARHGVAYHCHDSVLGALGAHFRFMKRMGSSS